MLLRDLSLAALLLLSATVFADDSVNTTDTTVETTTNTTATITDPQKMDDAIESMKVFTRTTKEAVYVDNNLPPIERH